jgi:hypothetical protein
MSPTFDFCDVHGTVPAHRHRNPDGSEGGWRFIGVELKPSYYKQAVANLRAASKGEAQKNLFEDVGQELEAGAA